MMSFGSLRNAACVGLHLLVSLTARAGELTNPQHQLGGSPTGGFSTTADFESGCGLDAVAEVNGVEISRSDLHRYLEGSTGVSSLKWLIQFELVKQKLKQEGIVVTAGEVQRELALRALYSPDSERMLRSSGPQYEVIEGVERFNLMVDKLLTRNIKVTEPVLARWFEQRKEYYSRPLLVKFTVLATSTRFRADTLARKLKDRSKSFGELVEEQKHADDTLATSFSGDAPGYHGLESLFPEWRTVLTTIKVGENSPILQFQPDGKSKGYVILRLTERRAADVPDFKKMRTLAELDYKLEQVAQRVVRSGALLNKMSWGSIVQGVTLNLQQQMRLVELRPTYRQVLRALSQTEALNLVNSLQNSNGVKIRDQSFKELRDDFKPSVARAGRPARVSSPK